MISASLSFSLTLLFLLLVVVFLFFYGVSDLPEPQLELGCGLLQHDCQLWLCTIFQVQRLWSFDWLSLSALQCQILGWDEQIGPVLSAVHPVVQSSALGNRLLSRHVEGHASWHVQSGLFRGSVRAAEELWTAVWSFFCQSTGAFRVSKCSGQVFRTPAAGTWSLFGS